jgi:Flp pilus assembly protein TadG
MVEFALVLPILVMLLVGIIEFGSAYNTQLALQASAREGARAALRRSPAEVESAARNAAAPHGTEIAVDLSGADCPATSEPWAGDEAEVTVSKDFTFEIPFVSLGTVELHATGVMRCGA